MHSRRRARVVALLSTAWLSFALAPIATAAPAMRYTWGPASGVQLREDFAGPATYAQTLSVTGLSGPVSRLSTRILHGPYAGPDPDDVWGPLYASLNGPPAIPPLDDCLGDPFYVVTPAVAGAATIPGATLGAVVVSYQGPTNFKTYSFAEIELLIDPPLLADPATTYAIATIEYDFRNATAGSAGAGCRNADRPFCFVQTEASATVNGLLVPAVIETGILSWQRDPDVDACYNAITPARASTWGAVRTMYR